MSVPPRAPRSPLATRLLLTIAFSAAIALSWSAPLDSLARERMQATFESALVSFAIARSLNGVISVAQGTEIAVQPAGVGMVVTAGEILDPLNDLVEQFSELVLLAVASLGVQIVLTEVFAAPWMNVLLTAGLVVAGIALWLPVSQGARRTLVLFAGAVLFARFVIVLATLGSSYLSQAFLDEREEAAIAFLSHTTSATRAAAPDPPTDESALDRLERLFSQPRGALDIEARLERLESEVENGITQLINLIVVYVLETLLLPIALLVVAYLGTRALLRAALRDPP